MAKTDSPGDTTPVSEATTVVPENDPQATINEPVASSAPGTLAGAKKGDIVLWTLGDGKRSGTSRPAIVLEVNPDESLDLQVFTAGFDDYAGAGADGLRVNNAQYDASGLAGTWHLQGDEK